MTGSRWIAVGAIFCGLAVGMGAFGAHELKTQLPVKYAGQTKDVAGQIVPLATEYLNVFKTGAEYQMYHGLAIIVAGLMADRIRGSSCAAWAFSIGIILFSGSLYMLTLSGVTNWGMVTPIGGVAFLVGWVLLTASALRRPS